MVQCNTRTILFAAFLAASSVEGRTAGAPLPDPSGRMASTVTPGDLVGLCLQSPTGIVRTEALYLEYLGEGSGAAAVPLQAPVQGEVPALSVGEGEECIQFRVVKVSLQHINHIAQQGYG